MGETAVIDADLAALDQDGVIRALLVARLPRTGNAPPPPVSALLARLDAASLAARPDLEYIGPLLYDIARRRDAGAHLRATLSSLYESQALGSVRRLHEAGKAVAALQAVGVEPIVLKGAALAECLYEHIALRPMRDIDLLVRPEQRGRALAALADLGYLAAAPGVRPDFSGSLEREVTLVNEGPAPVALDLHWSLLESPLYERPSIVDWLWATVVPCAVGGRPALMLGPEAQLLHLCGHAARHHQGTELLWHYDVALVLHTFANRLDWGVVLAQARALALVRPLRRLLAHLADRWLAPIPADQLARLAHLEPHPLERWLPGETGAHPPAIARLYVGHLLTLPGWPARLHFLTAQLFPSPAYMRYRFPHLWPRSLRRTLVIPYIRAYLNRWRLGFAAIVIWLWKSQRFPT